uniref:Uncharacterized protein n=1 Tax=Solanum lycopersicum TaxID=4081 RepID=A0A3Q7FKI2_SOLLC
MAIRIHFFNLFLLSLSFISLSFLWHIFILLSLFFDLFILFLGECASCFESLQSC